LPNGNLASASDDTTIIIWNQVDGSPIRTLRGHTAPVTSLVVFSQNGYLASGTYSKAEIKIWTTSDTSPISTISTGTYNIYALAVLENGALVVSLTGRIIRIYNASTGVMITEDRRGLSLGSASSGIISLAVLPNALLAAGSRTTNVCIWNTDTLSTWNVKYLTGHINYVNSVVVLPSGYLASASDDKTIIIWDVNANQRIRTLEGHSSSVRSLAVLANGYLASASDDQTIKIWNADNGTLIQSIDSGYSSKVKALAVLQNRLLASGGAAQTDVKVWDAETIYSCSVISATTTPPPTTTPTTTTTTPTTTTSTTTPTTTVYVPTTTTTPFVPISFTEFPISVLYSFGTLQSDNKLPKKDDISFGPVSLSNPFWFGNNSYSSVFISTNGYVTFSYYDEFTPILANDLSLAIIAPLFNDFDIKKKGDVFYRETTDGATLSSISGLIKTLFEQTPSDLGLSSAFIATWSAVPLYGVADSSNTFQLVLASYNSCYSYVLFLYQTLSSQSEFKAGYYANLQTNGQVASGVIEGLLNSGTSTGYAFKINPASQSQC
jgi:WD40 repeat protein